MASIWTTLAKALRVDAPRRAAESDAPPAAPAPFEDDGNAPAWGSSPRQAQFGRFQPIIDAMRIEMVHLARTELAAHRAINPNFHCQITTIEMLPRSAAAEAPLNSLLMMHRPERLAAMLKDLLGKLPYGSYFDFSAFGGVVPMPFAGSVPQSEVQALLDDIHADAKRSRAYKVTIRWNPADHPPLTEPAQIAAAAAPNLDAVLWELSDGQGRREVAMDRRSKTDPLLLGTLESADIALDGKYTSGRHGAIWFDKGCWWYRDLGSTNGSRVVHPDERAVVFPASGTKTPPPAAAELTPGCRIVFTATEEGEPADYPVLQRPGSDRARATPQAPSMRGRAEQALLDAPGSAPEALARLRIIDALGEREISIVAGQLPFTIGRDQTQSCAVPWDHKTVSGRHLVLVAIEDQGARFRMIGNNGGTLAKKPVHGGAEALWPWDAAFLLGQPPAGEAEYCLALLRP